MTTPSFKPGGHGRTGLPSYRGLGQLCLIAGGGLLALVGVILALRVLYFGPAARAEVQARLQAALLQTLEAITVEVQGSDPFRDRSDACSLRVLAISTAGALVTSDIRSSRLVPLAETAAPGPATHGTYSIPWTAVVAGATSEEGRALAAGIARLGDLRRLESVAAAVVTRSAAHVTMPDSVRLATRSEPPFELSMGRRAYQEVEPTGAVSIWGYDEEQVYNTLNARLTGWKAEALFWRSQPSQRGLLLGLAAIGCSLLAVGIKILGDGRTAEPQRRATPTGVSAWAAPVFVWGVWALLLLASPAYIARFAHNAPFLDDWNFVPAVTGSQPLTLGDYWEQWAEHRYPLTKVFMIGLTTLSGCDFRAATYFRTVALGAMALAMILVARRLRGWTSYTDAFFPLLLLQWGFPEQPVEAWAHLAYIVPTVIATPVLLIAALRGTRLTLPTALLAGTFMVLLPLCSAAGLLYLPPLLVWMAYSAVVSWRSTEPHSRRTSAVILGGIVTVVFVVVLYFVGYDKIVSSDFSPRTYSVLTVSRAILAVVSSSLGAAAQRYWPISGLGMLILVTVTTGILVLIAWRDPQGSTRARAVGLLCFLGGALLLAAGLGWGRAGMGDQYGFLYPTLSILIPCTIYLAWGLDGFRRRGHLVQAGLFLCVSLTTCFNIPVCVRAGREFHELDAAFERDVRQGMPSYWLIARHREALGLRPFPIEFSRDRMRMLKRAGAGPFRSLQDDPPFRVVPIPLNVVEMGDVEWDRGTVRLHSNKSLITFALPEPMYVAAIRIQCGALSKPAAVLVGVSWRGMSDLTIPPARYESALPVNPSTFAVADTIDRIRIYPNLHKAAGTQPLQFPITKLEVLVPAVPEVRGSIGVPVDQSTRRR